jgi:hypothetical protein
LRTDARLHQNIVLFYEGYREFAENCERFEPELKSMLNKFPNSKLTIVTRLQIAATATTILIGCYFYFSE